MVIPGRAWAVHEAPLFVETETPMSEAPPSVKRPHCAAATIVLPNAYVSGSTIVACWLVEFVNGSVAMMRTETFAAAASASTSAAVATKETPSRSRRGIQKKANRIRLSPFLGPVRSASREVSRKKRRDSSTALANAELQM